MGEKWKKRAHVRKRKGESEREREKEKILALSRTSFGSLTHTCVREPKSFLLHSKQSLTHDRYLSNAHI